MSIPQPLPHIAKLHAYTPGLQPTDSGWVKLNTNENPYPPSPRVADAVIRELGPEKDAASLRLYPNPTSAPLREAIAKLHAAEASGLTAKNVCVGNGSDDILNLIIRAYCSTDNALSITQPSYSLYPVLVEIQNGRTEAIPFTREMHLPIDRMASSSAPALILTSPNAPTGIGFPNTDLARILEKYRGLLVVDEAYALFAQENTIPLLSRYPNVMVVRTLSKSHALAGIRVGYALGAPEVIENLDRVRDSYNVSRLSQAAALAAISDTAYYDGIVSKIKTTRDRAAAAFAAMGWFTYPSQSNFLFTEPKNRRGETGPAVAKSAYDYLYTHKILVRYFPSLPLTASFLRISVGTDAEMLAVDQALKAWQQTA